MRRVTSGRHRWILLKDVLPHGGGIAMLKAYLGQST